MDRLLLGICLGLTSIASYWLGRRALDFDRVRPLAVLTTVVECLGVSVLFLVANVFLGALLAVAVRSLTSYFVGLYIFSDAVLLPLSLVQGLAFWSWRARARARGRW